MFAIPKSQIWVRIPESISYLVSKVIAAHAGNSLQNTFSSSIQSGSSQKKEKKGLKICAMYLFHCGLILSSFFSGAGSRGFVRESKRHAHHHPAASLPNLRVLRLEVLKFPRCCRTRWEFVQDSEVIYGLKQGIYVGRTDGLMACQREPNSSRANGRVGASGG